VGKQTGRKYQLGDELKIAVWRTNLAKKHLDFRLAENGSGEEKINERLKPKSKRRR